MRFGAPEILTIVLTVVVVIMAFLALAKYLIRYNVTTGEWVVHSGACAQCTKCNLVIVTQNDPGSGAALGYYTTWQPNEELSSYNTIINQSSNNIIYTSSTSIPGIRFRFA